MAELVEEVPTSAGFTGKPPRVHLPLNASQVLEMALDQLTEQLGGAWEVQQNAEMRAIGAPLLNMRLLFHTRVVTLIPVLPTHMRDAVARRLERCKTGARPIGQAAGKGRTTV